MGSSAAQLVVVLGLLKCIVEPVSLGAGGMGPGNVFCNSGCSRMRFVAGNLLGYSVLWADVASNAFGDFRLKAPYTVCCSGSHNL